MNFVIFDAAGKILRTGSCPEDHLEQQAGPGEFVMEGTANDATQCVVNGHICARAPDPAPELTYVQKRRREYPSIAEQLDALWKGGPEFEAMKAKINSVKAKYPKPDEAKK